MATSPTTTRIPRLAVAASQAIAAALITLHSPVAAAAGHPRSKTEPELVDFAKLAQQRPRACGSAAPAMAGPAEWKASEPLCVWQGRLQMRRWQADANPAQRACTAAPAQWLAWQRARLAIPNSAPGAAWHTEWTSHYLAGPAMDGMVRIATVERRAPGGWLATEWTWSPSPRAATRAWQQGRFKLLAQAASRAHPATVAASGPLRAVWEKNLAGRAAEAGPDGWRWNSAGNCLRMVAMAPAGVPLPLPYAREDARLEQRAAMQIQLARRHPGATFLMPFRLLDAPAAAPRSGAKYVAIWTDRALVTGQLWITRKDDAQPIRAQVTTTLPGRYDTPAGLAAGAGALRAIERELTGIAAIWSADYER